MGLDELARQYAALPPHERALFAALIRAQEVFNNPEWRETIAQRHQAVDAGCGVRVVNATEVLAAKSAGETAARDARPDPNSSSISDSNAP